MKKYIDENILVDNISVCGYSHIKLNRECQDASVSWKKKQYAAIIVCDGHGGDKYIRSAYGSAIACEVGKQTIDEFMDQIYVKTPIFNDYTSKINVSNYDMMLSRLERSVIQRWNESILKDYTENPLNNDERWEKLSVQDKHSLSETPVKAYGTTFIAAVLTKDFHFIIKLGDGNANLILDDNTVIVPKELEDESFKFNFTSSLCNSDADIVFKHYFSETNNNAINPVVGIFLSSDGIINCYHTENAYFSFIKNVYCAYGEDGVDKAKNELINVLNILSEKGSGDDLSIGIIRKIISKKDKEYMAVI